MDLKKSVCSNADDGSFIPIIQDDEFRLFRDMIYNIAGISMGPAKKSLVGSRLMRRLRYYEMTSYREYFFFIGQPVNREELQVAVDLLTTNETYFFREQKHFDFLADKIIPEIPAAREFRVWSAACSSGEEAYSIAMVAQEMLGNNRWKIMASDLSTRVLSMAGDAIYPLSRTVNIPDYYRKKYCLKGIESQDGKILIDNKLRNNVRFFQHNLTDKLPDKELFDVIFLRNVMIYFDQETKRRVIDNILPNLRPGGYFFISHSETLNGISTGLFAVKPAIYQKCQV